MVYMDTKDVQIHETVLRIVFISVQHADLLAAPLTMAEIHDTTPEDGLYRSWYFHLGDSSSGVELSFGLAVRFS